MNETTKLVIGTAMRTMFKKGWVDICTIRECLALAGIVPLGQSHDLLHALHCVHFKDMPTELAEKIPQMVCDCFNGMRIHQLMEATEPATGIGARLSKLLN